MSIMTVTAETYWERALVRANEIRFARADEKNRIKALPECHGKREVVRLLLNPPSCIENMGVLDLIRCIQHWGPTRSRKLCSRLMIGEMKGIGALTERQRRALVKELLKTGLQ